MRNGSLLGLREIGTWRGRIREREPECWEIPPNGRILVDTLGFVSMITLSTPIRMVLIVRHDPQTWAIQAKIRTSTSQLLVLMMSRVAKLLDL